MAKHRNSGKAIRKRRPADVSGGTLSTAILIPSQVVPQLRHTIKNITLVTRPANHCFWVLFWRCFRARRTLASFIASLSRN
jgi:hypothetical protein